MLAANCPTPFPGERAILPVGVACSSEGLPGGWKSSRLILASFGAPWSASRPYFAQLLVQDAGSELPEYLGGQIALFGEFQASKLPMPAFKIELQN